MNNKSTNEEIFEYKMYITDLETNKKSKEINVSDLVFNDYIEFEFGNYEDEDYETLPYKDFKFFINDYAVTFYSPQCENLQQELDQYKNKVEYYENFEINKTVDKIRLKHNKEIKKLNNIINELDKQNRELGENLSLIEDKLNKTNWWLENMLKQATNAETKAIINGTLELLDKGGDE